MSQTPPEDGPEEPLPTDEPEEPDATGGGDAYGDPVEIADSAGSETFDMTAATLEPGEPGVAGGTSSRWFDWIAPPDTDRALFIGTAGARVAVYAYAATLGALAAAVGTGEPSVKVTVTPGSQYRVQYVLLAGDPAVQTLTWADGAPPDHDDFADALEIDGQYGVAVVTLTAATTETGEPGDGRGSVWAAWTAPADQHLGIDVYADDGVTATVYTGATLGTLNSVATGTVADGLLTLNVDVVDAVDYRLQITGDSGEVTFGWSVQAVPVEPKPPHEYVRVTVHNRSDDSLISEVPRRFGLRANEVLNSSGTGEMAVSLDDPLLVAYPTILTYGNIVRFWLGDVCFHGFRIRRRGTTIVDTGERVTRVRRVAGPSVQHLLDDFMVRHDGPVRKDSLDERVYSWASMEGEWYDAADWDNWYEVDTLQDPPGSGAKKKHPKRWRDPGARWLWRRKRQGNKPNRGRHYYRRNFTVARGGTVARLMATADEAFRVYLDGEEILSEDNVETGYTSYAKVDLVLSKGTHTLAAFAKSLRSSRGGDSNDSILLTLMKVNSRGKARGVIVHTDSTWDSFHGTGVPGWNRAQVLRNCIQEAQARGNDAAQQITLGFGATTDSDGKAWTDRWGDAVSIGTSGLDLQALLSEGNGFDVWVDPGDLTIYAWRRRGEDRSASVTLEPGRNLLNWSVDGEDEVKNTWLIQYDGGWTTLTSRKSTKEYGDREGFLSLGHAKDEEDAQRLVHRVSQGVGSAVRRAGTDDVRVRRTSQPEGGLIAVDGARPFLDFGVGDTVKAPNDDGVLVKYRVLGLSIQEDQVGTLSYDQDVQEVVKADVWRGKESRGQRQARAQRAANPGMLDGRARAAAPIPNRKPAQRAGEDEAEVEAIWSHSGVPEEDVESPPYYVRFEDAQVVNLRAVTGSSPSGATVIELLVNGAVEETATLPAGAQAFVGKDVAVDLASGDLLSVRVTSVGADLETLTVQALIEP